MIRFENVSKHFRRREETVRALDDVSFSVPEGALVLVRGPSGSGKTTLVNLAAGLSRPTSGAVTVAGARLYALSPKRRAALRARRIAVVFQTFHLVPYLSALENVLLPTLADGRAAGDAPDTRARELLDGLGMARRVGHLPEELSVGERQRCALARALLNRPEIILADEPTGNLDPESADHVLRTLGQCHADGATVLLVSHHPVEAIQPDLELRLEDGRLQPAP